ncbi:MAG TPA: hypothetical protein VIQ27_01825 [Gemmatimonadales bacterium]
MPICAEDKYPMVPVRDGAGGIEWGCTNLWHPRAPGPCPACGNAGQVRTSTAGLYAEAICAICRHRWIPFPAEGELRRPDADVPRPVDSNKEAERLPDEALNCPSPH